jgi:hypothetical protein
LSRTSYLKRFCVLPGLTVSTACRSCVPTRRATGYPSYVFSALLKCTHMVPGSRRVFLRRITPGTSS